VHLGVNAIARLRAALDTVTGLGGMAVVASSAEVAQAIAATWPVSKILSETGEAETLAWGTINIGQVSGGPSMNLAPAAARAGIDIHFPVDITAAEAEVQLAATLSQAPE